MLIQTVRNSPTPVHLFKVKSHAGIASNESSDAVAKYQATQVDIGHVYMGMPYAGVGGNVHYDITWLAFDRNSPLNAKILRFSYPPTLKLW